MEEKLLQEYLKQKEELEKLINELRSQMSTTNIPFSGVFLENFPMYNVEKVLQKDQKELLKLKLFINKKCNQISTDPQHSVVLLEELKSYQSDKTFQDLFILKLLDQGKNQVSAHIDFFKPIGYILSQMVSSLEQQYIRMALYKNANEMDIRGIYAVYFGALYYRNDYKTAWLFLASVLNVEPNYLTSFVLEAFFYVLTDLLAKGSKPRLTKIYNYLNNIFFKKMNNEPVQIRIKKCIEQYL